MKTIGLIANPNVGKTVIFNALTGARQSVANFPGVTVEKKTGILRHNNEEITVVDLPGIYSLTASSIDEKITRQFIIEEKPDLIVNIIDSSNLDRNLYLTLQLLELGANLLVVLNMGDIAENKGVTIDTEALSKLLKVPIIETIAPKKKGILELKTAILEHSNKKFTPTNVSWFDAFSSEIVLIKESLKSASVSSEKWSLTWAASALLEGDEVIHEILEESGVDFKLIKKAVEEATEKLLEGDAELAFADARYKHIFTISKKVKTKTLGEQWTKTDMMDEVLTHKYFGIPIFLVVFWGVFHFVFSFGDPFIGLVELILGKLSDLIIDDFGADPDNFFTGLLTDGIIGGVGGILVFLPIIALLFIAIGILEDTGYLARVAFLMDKIMNRFGLNGQAIVPMLLGFGCNIPAIMSTRTIKSEKERLTSIFVNGFISCGARLPIYVLVAGALYSETEAANVALLMYLIGMIVAITTAWVLRKTYFKGETSPFIMELPTYLRPSITASLIKLWQRCKGFLYKAGTIILVSAIIIYCLDYFEMVEPIGKVVATLFWWMEIEWELGAALLFGLIAKEVVVGALGVLLQVENSPDDPEDTDLRSALKTRLNEGSSNVDATAFSYMVFSLLYVPCFAALGAVRQETNSWKMTFWVTVMYITVAYVLAALTMAIGVLIF
ncbi:MAG: ferrous iron transport protein B [Candidatus Kariarchaeaceae archaeon]